MQRRYVQKPFAAIGKIMSVAILIGCITTEVFGVSLPYYDPFDYAEGRLNDVGAPNWTAGSTGPELMVTNPAALTAPAGFPAASGKGVRRAPSGTARRSVLAFDQVPAVDGNEVYASFLLKVVSAPPSTQLLAYLTDTSSSQSSPQAGIFITSDARIGIGKRASGPGFTMATNLGPDEHLIIIRYLFQSGNDRVDLWVDPDPATYSATTPPESLGYTTGSSDPSFIGYFQLYTTPQTGGEQFIDEIRVGRTWADVVPSGAPLVGTKLGFTVQPTNAVANAIMNPVVVQVQSDSGAAVASNGVPVTLTLTSGSGMLSGTLTRYTDANGRAVFDDLSIDTPGTGKRLTATASGIGEGLASAVSAPFTILEPPAYATLLITDAAHSTRGFVVSGGSPNAGQFAQILGTTDHTQPLTNWLLVQYGNFDSSGRITFTNPVSPAIPQAFYRLRTGDTTTKLVPPSIVAQPASQIVSPGATAVFNVVAVGPQLHYLWLFNGTPMPGQTNDTLVVHNAQSVHEGNYQVIVANVVNSITSSVASLQVGNVAPTITTQPQDQNVIVGGTAIFSVAATGTVPLSYQWYYNTNTPLPGATNAQLVLSNVTTNYAGKYRVVVANAFGSATSEDATLSVTEVPTAPPPTNMVGFAALAGVTGGAGGYEVEATNYTQFRAYCRSNAPLIIKVIGRIEANESYCYVRGANKTIIGVGTNAEFVGDLRINTNNIIVANITFYSPTNDGITIDTGGSGTGQGVWIDHCTFVDCADGSVDITKGADYVTVSWCKFVYPTGRSHAFVNLLGSSDNEPESMGKLHVTFCYNWYGEGCLERMPSVRYGKVHVFNNYYDCQHNNYCIRTRLYAQVLVENNYFLGVQNPWERLVTVGDPGLLRASGNITNNCTWNATWYPGVQLIPGTDYLPAFDPVPYTYTVLPADWVPYYVTRYAGAGKYPYVSE